MREELLQEYLLWNAQAFKMLYNNYYKVLSNYAFQILKDNATAEDVVQGIFSFLYESRPNLLPFIQWKLIYIMPLKIIVLTY